MQKNVQVGDVVESTAGRDKGLNLIVVKSNGNQVWLTDGRTRKVTALKKKSIKHIKIILSDADKPLAERIAQGDPVSNERVKKLIASVQKLK